MGGHSDKSLFSDTSASRLAADNPGVHPSDGGKAGAIAPKPAPGLKNHIENGGGASRSGIDGCHNKDNFERAIQEAGGVVESSTPSEIIDGVEHLTYRLPKKDKTGKRTGEMQSKEHSKTVYDPSKISTDEYIDRGLQAAADAARESRTGKLGREWTGRDAHGVSWRGYSDSGGNVTSFYPTE